MTLQNENPGTKAIYTKPTLSEYGSLAERTRIFGLEPDANPDLASVAILGIAVSVAI